MTEIEIVNPREITARLYGRCGHIQFLGEEFPLTITSLDKIVAEMALDYCSVCSEEISNKLEKLQESFLFFTADSEE